MIKRKKIILNAVILTLSTMMLGFVGMIFRVYLSNKIGAEGMGLFQLIMSINIMTSTFAISGIRVTLTRLVAEELAKGNPVDNIVKKGFVYSLIFSITAAVLLYNNAEFISILFLKDVRAIVPLKILSCSLPFTGICACLNGYFYGARKVTKSVGADILESCIMIGIILFSINTFSSKDLEYTCSLICLSMSISILISTFYLYILYIFDRNRKYKVKYCKEKAFTLLHILNISLPIACSAYIQTSLKTVEDILIPSKLRQFGSSNSSSLAIFGMVKGMVLPLLVFPSIFLASFSTLIIPEIAEANTLNKNKYLNYILSRVIKFTLILAMFATGLFIIFSTELSISIYNNHRLSAIVRILSPLIPLMYLDRIVDGSLNALNQQMKTLKYNLIDISVKIFMICFLIPRYGIEGFFLVLFISTILNSSLSINRLLKVTKLQFDILDWVINPILSIIISCFTVKILFRVIGISQFIISQIITVALLYFIFLLLFKCITKRDISWFIDGFKQDIKQIDWNNIRIYKQF